MVSCLSVASWGRVETNFKVVLQAVVAGAAAEFVCLGNETFYVHSLISYSLSLCSSNIFCGQLDSSLWHSASQEKAQNTFLWYSCTFSCGTDTVNALFWVSSCPLFSVAGELQDMWHENAYKSSEISSSNKATSIPAPYWPCWNALCPWCGSSSVLSVVISQWTMHFLSCITQVAQEDLQNLTLM